MQVGGGKLVMNAQCPVEMVRDRTQGHDVFRCVLAGIMRARHRVAVVQHGAEALKAASGLPATQCYWLRDGRCNTLVLRPRANPSEHQRCRTILPNLCDESLQSGDREAITWMSILLVTRALIGMPENETGCFDKFRMLPGNRGRRDMPKIMW
jgi:hypothetical protein